MTDPVDLLAELRDFTTPPIRLAEIAYAAPHLQAEVAAHPNAYPALLEWIAQNGDARAQARATAIRGGSAGAEAPSAPVHTFEMTPDAPRRPRRRTIGITVAAVTVGALVVGGGIAAAVILPRVLPAGSPEAAVDRLLTSTFAFDAIGAATTVAPSEISIFSSSLLAPSAERSEDETVARAVEALADAVTVTVDGLAYESTELADGIMRVRVVDGAIEIDGDEEEIADAVMSAAAPAIEEQLDAAGLTYPEIERQLDLMENQIEDALDLPLELDFAALADDDVPTSLVAVRENGGWFVSPLLSYADIVYQLQAQSDDELELGSEVPAASPAADAADAFEQSLRAALDTNAGDGYWPALAATLPLAERRLAALYGPLLGADPWSLFSSDGWELTVVEASFDAGDSAHASVGEVHIEWTHGLYGGGGLRVEETCAAPYSLVDAVEVETSAACLEDLPIDTAALGLADPQFFALEEAGGWLFSPLGTIGEWVSIANARAAELAEAGELDDIRRS